nr:hypothetical protein GCM10020092_006370 [Actinoplanes digitatis]
MPATAAATVSAGAAVRVAAAASVSAPVGQAAAGSASVGAARVGSASVGSASVGSASVGSASAGSASVGSASVGSASVGSARVGSASVGSGAVGSGSAGAGHVGSGPANGAIPRARTAAVAPASGGAYSPGGHGAAQVSRGGHGAAQVSRGGPISQVDLVFQGGGGSPAGQRPGAGYELGHSGSAWAERSSGAEYWQASEFGQTTDDGDDDYDAGSGAAVEQRPSRRHAAPDTGTDLARFGIGDQAGHGGTDWG